MFKVGRKALASSEHYSPLLWCDRCVSSFCKREKNCTCNMPHAYKHMCLLHIQLSKVSAGCPAAHIWSDDCRRKLINYLKTANLCHVIWRSMWRALRHSHATYASNVAKMWSLGVLSNFDNLNWIPMIISYPPAGLLLP